MISELRVLIIEDSEDDALLLRIELERAGFVVDALRVESEAEMTAALQRGPWNLILCDYRLPRFNAPDALALLKATGLDVPFIVVSGAVGEDAAVAMMRAGASDYLMKNNLARLGPAVRRELGEAESRLSRMVAEQRLSETEASFRLLSENLKDYALIMLDPAGHITNWNQGCQRVTGFYEDDVLGQSFALLFTDEDRALDVPALELADAERCGQKEDERWHVKKDGTLFFADGVTTALFDAAGRLKGFAKIARDITDKKRAEQKLERLLEAEKSAREEAQRYNRIKDEFLATLSHELRTPLNVILGHIELLDFEEPGSVPYAESLSAIRRNAHAQAQLVNDLLDVSRIITGKLALSLEQVAVDAILPAARDSIRLAAEAKQITVDMALTPGLPCVSGDRDRLQQVFWNLLSNAVKFTPPGGRIRIRAYPDGDSLRIDITDSGRGIHPEFLPHVFERFRQEDQSTTRSFGGLGLGLAIVRHLVELHGGRVHATSEGKNQGATFSILLPCPERMGSASKAKSQDEESMVSERAGASQHLLAGVSVLVVEDHEDTRLLVRKMLEGQGAQVTLTDCADEALAVMEKQPFDVLLSDIGMPTHDGIFLIKRVRELEDGQQRRTPAAAVTAYARPEDLESFVAAGFEDIVAKPLSTERLVGVVARLTGRAAAESTLR